MGYTLIFDFIMIWCDWFSRSVFIGATEVVYSFCTTIQLIKTKAIYTKVQLTLAVWHYD